jgi:hypothetical protein
MSEATFFKLNATPQFLILSYRNLPFLLAFSPFEVHLNFFHYFLWGVSVITIIIIIVSVSTVLLRTFTAWHRSFRNLIKKLGGRAMAQAVSHRLLTAEARVRIPVNPCGICGGQSGSGTGFSLSSSVFSYQYIFHRRSPNSYHMWDEQYVRWWQQFWDTW